MSRSSVDCLKHIHSNVIMYVAMLESQGGMVVCDIVMTDREVSPHPRQ